MSNLRPTYVVPDFASVPVQELAERGIEGIAFDVDQCIVPHNGDIIPAVNLRKFDEISSCMQAVVMLSNADKDCRQKRARGFGEDIENDSEVDSDALHVVLSGVVGRRKGHHSMFRAACEAAGIDPERMAMVDDQLWRGIRGANRYGFGATVLVSPIGRCGNFLKDNPMRILEAVCLELIPAEIDLTIPAAGIAIPGQDSSIGHKGPRFEFDDFGKGAEVTPRMPVSPAESSV